MSVRLQAEPFDVGPEILALGAGDDDVGAIVSFTGLCRAGDGSERVTAMTLDHYPALARAELETIEAEARARWPLKDVRIVHRFGRLTPGDVIVMVAVASRHRAAAFEAAASIMDVLKTRAPFWKREEGARGQVAWVEARVEDDRAAARWSAARPA